MAFKPYQIISIAIYALFASQSSAVGYSCEGICSGGLQVPNPDRRVSTNTCSEWNEIAKESTAKHECDTFQAVTGAACGCEDPPKSGCDVCPHGLKWGSKVYYEDDTEETCENAIFWMSSNPEGCEKYAEHVSRYCCFDSCSICHGGSFSSNELIEYENGSTMSCGNAALTASFLSAHSDDCIDIQSRAAKYCSCETQREKCTLCANGAPPPLKDAIIMGENSLTMSCSKAHHSAPYLNARSESCPVVQANGVLYCGCELSNEGCSLCGDNKRVESDLRDNEIVSGGIQMSCAELEAFLNTMDPASEKCEASLELRSECCELKSERLLRKRA